MKITKQLPQMLSKYLAENVNIKHGSTRITVSGKRLTAKIAKIEAGIAYAHISGMIRSRRWNELREYVTEYWDDSRSLSSCLFDGVVANMREARHSTQLGEVVVPTYFSFMGIFNIMPTSQPHGLDNADIIMPIGRRIGGAAIHEDAHTFGNPNNYGVHRGKLKVHDYGSKAALGVMLRFRTQFIEALEESTTKISF